MCEYLNDTLKTSEDNKKSLLKKKLFIAELLLKFVLKGYHKCSQQWANSTFLKNEKKIR